MSNTVSTHLCRIERLGASGQERVCEVSSQRITTLVIALIGLALLATGLYLLLGGVGTIPALTGGSGLLAGGVATLAFALFCVCRSNKHYIS